MPTKAKDSQAFPALSLDGMFLLTPDEHRTVAKDLRRQVNDPKAQELATAHEKLAAAIQKHLDEQVPPLAQRSIPNWPMAR